MEFRIEAHRDRMRAVDDAERGEARDAIRALARPRRTGSAGAAEVEAELRRRFEGLGYTIQELPFTFSAWPGRYGVPAAGAVGLLGLGVGSLALARREPLLALAGLGGAAALIAFAGLYATRAIAHLPWGRVRGVNWLVHRPGARPRHLVAAHRDSKSQPISTFLRVAAVVLAGFAWVALAALAAIGLVDETLISTPLVLALGALGGVGAALLIACHAGNASPGALDNATGLAALLGIARRERNRSDVAFLVTDAEELGLAGARDVARRLPPVEGIINLDGLDDVGTFRVAERIGIYRRRVLAPHLAAALLASAESLRIPIQRRDLPAGVLVDHIAFGRAGYPAVTVLRGGARSLLRVHRPGDTADRLDGTGVAMAVALVCGALELLRGRAGRMR
ncbi:MAG TPA: M28 family peptidase [Longimicrobiales bacterium]